MATIAVKNLTAFDAGRDHEAAFSYSGPQCTKNRIIIYDNATGRSVYDHTVTSFNLLHTIPAGTLINGKAYYCTISAYYSSGAIEYSVTSRASNVFLCLTSAAWGFHELENGGVIGNAYYTFSIDYFQPEGETVNEFQIDVYTSSHTLFWSSGILYDSASTATVGGLANGSVYYIRAHGVTTNGLTLDTRTGNESTDISVSVAYIEPSTYALAHLENNAWQGYIKISTNVASIEGRSVSGNEIVFIDGDYADLTAPVDGVIFDENFQLSGDFTLEFEARNIAVNTPILASNIGMEIRFGRGRFDEGRRQYAKLSLAETDYVLHSNLIEIPEPDDNIYLWLQRKGSLYTMKIKNKGVGS